MFAEDCQGSCVGVQGGPLGDGLVCLQAHWVMSPKGGKKNWVMEIGIHEKGQFATYCSIRTVEKRMFITQMSANKAACFVDVFGKSVYKKQWMCG